MTRLSPNAALVAVAVALSSTLALAVRPAHGRSANLPETSRPQCKGNRAVVLSSGTIRTSAAGRQRILIIRGGHWLSIEPPCPEILEALRTTVFRAVNDDRHGGRIGAETEPLLMPPRLPATPRPDQRLPAPTAGLEPIVRYLALKSGFEVKRRWYSPRPTRLPEPEVEAVCKSGPCDSQLLSFVQRFEPGLIRHRPGVNRCWLLARMIRAWSDASFAIATASYPEAKRIRKGLHGFGIRTSLVTTKRCPDRPGRVVIGTYTAMAHRRIECNKRDIFICANAAHALGEAARCCLLQVDSRFRLFGLLPDDRRLSPAEKDWVIATFGLREIAVPAHGYEDIKPCVVWVPFRCRCAGSVDIYKVKRQLIWNPSLRRHPVVLGLPSRQAVAVIHIEDATALKQFIYVNGFSPGPGHPFIASLAFTCCHVPCAGVVVLSIS